jgi:DNA/RNA-binding domain of Phe-tRNA-synthetase-like protein
MVNISISEKLKCRCPKLRLSCIEADVLVSASVDGLISEIDSRITEIRKTLIVENIAKIPVIEASRKAYKVCGKDPARYRLSAEALLRRIVSGKGIYQISNVVDQLNLVSISTGFSIGGYDAGAIQGEITFGIGLPGEPYSGIGRGELNIENLPVFRDKLGAFGTPTSDSQRTEVTGKTSRFLMVLIDFGGDSQLETATQTSIRLLTEYCQASGINDFIIG